MPDTLKGHQHRWLGSGNRTFLEVASMVGSGFFVQWLYKHRGQFYLNMFDSEVMYWVWHKVQ